MKICSVDGCDRKFYSKGLCQLHYERMRAGEVKLSTIDFSNSNVLQRAESNIIPEPNSGCWLYLGWANKDGYGRIKIGNKKLLVSRIMYQAYKGVVREDDCVCHTCDNPSCCNPDHLFLGTRRDNANDMVRKKRQSVGENKPTAKLTDADVLYIRNSSEKQVDLAERFGIRADTISKIKNGKYWSHLPYVSSPKQKRLSTDDISRILEMKRLGSPLSEMAEVFGVSYQAVWKAIKKVGLQL